MAVAKDKVAASNVNIGRPVGPIAEIAILHLVHVAVFVADTEARFLEDFPSSDDTGIKLIRDAAEAHLMFFRAASANCADATLRADRRLTKAVKTLKARARQRKDAPKTTPAEWASDLVERYEKWEASQKSNR